MWLGAESRGHSQYRIARGAGAPEMVGEWVKVDPRGVPLHVDDVGDVVLNLRLAELLQGPAPVEARPSTGGTQVISVRWE